MELSAVLLARVLFFIESSDLNPRGAAFFPEIIRRLVERYQFQKFPQKLDELNLNNGVEFSMGRAGQNTIQKLIVYSHGLALETKSATRDSETILDEILTWAKAVNIQYRPEMIKRKGYVSQVTFYSKVPLLFINPILKDFSKRVSQVVSNSLQLKCVYEPNAVMIGLDPETQVMPTAVFSVERRSATGFSENKYFSNAPLPTEVHLAMLEEYEKTLAATHKQ